jgi:hypothetical protein
MTSHRIARCVKGTLVAALAACVCRRIWAHLVEWSDGISAAHSGEFAAGFYEGLLTSVVGLLSVPVLLWVAMRLLRERGNHALVVGGLVAWWLIGGEIVEHSPGAVATGLYIALFAVIGGVLSLAEVPAGRAAGSHGRP